MKNIFLLLLLCVVLTIQSSQAQENAIADLKIAPNTFILNNQNQLLVGQTSELLGRHVMQHQIAILVGTDNHLNNNLQLSYFFAMGLGSKHQVDLYVPYNATTNEALGYTDGLNTVYLTYHYQLSGKSRKFQIAPKVSLLFPTGNTIMNRGDDCWGYEVGLPISKHIGKHFLFKYTAAVQQLLHQKAVYSVDYPYYTNAVGNPFIVKNGLSAIWSPGSRLQFFFDSEYRMYQINQANQSLQLNAQSFSKQWINQGGVQLLFNTSKFKIAPSVSFPVFTSPSMQTRMYVMTGVSLQHKY